MVPDDDRRLSWAASAALLAIVFVTTLVSVTFVPEGGVVATFWPAAAFSVLVLALSSRRRWPVLAAALLVCFGVADAIGGREPRMCVAHAVIETLAALAAATLLTRYGTRRPELHDQEDFARLLGAATLSGGLVGLGGLVWWRTADLEPVVSSMATAVSTHASAVLVLVPLALIAGDRWAGGWAELGLQTTLLVVGSVLTFGSSESSALTFAPVLLLAWAAVRFDMRIATGELAAFGVFVTALTASGRGPFADAVSADQLTDLTGGAVTQGFLTCAALLVLPLGIAVQHTTLLLDRITADGRLFRRNFTESLVGMAFLEPAPDGRDLVVVDLNETAVGILGGTEDGLVGLGLQDIIETGPDYDAVLPRLLSGTVEGWRVEGALRGARQGQVTLQVSSLSEPGSSPFFAAQLLDVTAEAEARHGLEVAQQLTSATLDTTACIIMVTDLNGVVVRVNAATTVITGYAEAELLGRKVWDTGITPSDASDVEALFMWPNRSGVPVVRERDAITKAGEKLRIVWNTNIVRDDTGSAVYAVMTGIDVTAERTTAGVVNHLMEASFTTALVGIDTSGRISVVNSGMQHLLGFGREELVGQPFHRLLKPAELTDRTGTDDPDESFEVLVRELGHDGETRARDWTWITKAGAEKLVSMTLSVAQDAFAAQTGFLCVARDVTEQRHSQEMLIQALEKERTAVERLRSLDRAKNEFVSTVSHELRTPVTSIVGYTEMMQDGSVVEALPEQLPLLETIGRNGQRLIAMINDLLMLSGLDSETVQWRHDPVDLAATIGPVEDAIRPLLKGRQLALDFERPDSAVPVLGDRAQLERVMINLLSNAVKFTEDGGRVSFKLAADVRHAVITVSDDGIGIPAEEQADLFQRFFRSSTAQSRQIQGTGLGLSIVSAIVSGHGGTIEVESAHMEGSTFTVRLPLARSERLTAAG